MATGKFSIAMGNNRNLFADIERALKDLGEAPIVGALTVTGHEYWVILEYGSSPATIDPGPHASDDVILTLPDKVPDLPPDSVYPYSKQHGSYYPINPRRATFLRFFDQRVGRIVIRKPRNGRPAVLHPGVAARGFVRQAISVTVDSMAADFVAVFDSTDATIPSRTELVDIFNTRLLAMRDTIALNTPVADGRPTHPERTDMTPLAISWDVTLATAGKDQDDF